MPQLYIFNFNFPHHSPYQAGRMKNYYDILGISQDATPDEVRAAYYRLVRDNNPALHPGETKYQQIYADIEEAYATLKDQDLRDAYDHDLRWESKQRIQNERIAQIKERRNWGIGVAILALVFHLATCSHDCSDLTYDNGDTHYISIDSFRYMVHQYDSGSHSDILDLIDSTKEMNRDTVKR